MGGFIVSTIRCLAIRYLSEVWSSGRQRNFAIRESTRSGLIVIISKACVPTVIPILGASESSSCGGLIGTEKQKGDGVTENWVSRVTRHKEIVHIDSFVPQLSADDYRAVALIFLETVLGAGESRLPIQLELDP